MHVYLNASAAVSLSCGDRLDLLIQLFVLLLKQDLTVQFAKQNEGNKVEVVCTVSGWSKGEPRAYSVQLVPKAKLHGTLSLRRFLTKSCNLQELCLSQIGGLFTANLIRLCSKVLFAAIFGSCVF